MANQTPIESFLEIGVNVLIGYFIAMGIQTLVFPLYGITVSHSTNAQMTLIFTAVSMVRSYLIRRFFNNNLGLVVIKKIKSLIKRVTTKQHI